MTASWVEATSKWQACSWTTPWGQVWTIQDGVVVDEQGVEVEGVQAWEQELGACGLRIGVSSEVLVHLDKSLSIIITFKEHRGQWLVKTLLEDGRPLTLSLETEDEVSI